MWTQIALVFFKIIFQRVYKVMIAIFYMKLPNVEEKLQFTEMLKIPPPPKKKMRSELEIYQTRITFQFKLEMKVMLKVNTFITPLPITSAVFFRFHITIDFYYIFLPKSRKFG